MIYSRSSSSEQIPSGSVCDLAHIWGTGFWERFAERSSHTCIYVDRRNIHTPDGIILSGGGYSRRNCGTRYYSNPSPRRAEAHLVGPPELSLSPLSPPDGGGLSPCFYVRKRKNSCSEPLVYSGSTLPLHSGVYDSRGVSYTMKDTHTSNTIVKQP